MGKFWYTDASGKRKRTAAGKRREYKMFQSSGNAIKDRSARNSARRSALKSGLVHKGDGKVIDHKDSNPRNNAKSNLRVISKSANAGRRENSRKRGSKRSRYGD